VPRPDREPSNFARTVKRGFRWRNKLFVKTWTHSHEIYERQNMKSLKKAIGFGFVTWLVPFVVSVSIFPLKKAGDPLFETIMGLVVVFCGVFFAHLYFRSINRGFLKEGILAGTIWMLISLGLDLFMFSTGPMKMPMGTYMKDIGLGYFTFLIISVGAGWLLHCQATPGSEKMSSKSNLSPQLSTNDEAVHSG
jgi:hypothetical protein